MEFKKNEIQDFQEEYNNTLGAPTASKPKKRRQKMPWSARLLLIISVIVFAVSALIIYKNLEGRKKYYQMNSELESVFNSDNSGTDEPSFNFEEMLAKNSDFVGWITVPNTAISLPVVQRADNSYYLTHDFYKEYDIRGTVFMDYRNNSEDYDASTILYGHNCYDSTMFTDLEKYYELDFYKTSPVIEYSNKNGKDKWKIYAVFVTSAKADEDNGYIFNYIYPYMDGENFDGFINEVNKRRLYDTGVDINDDDNMLVLSTCTRKLDIYKSGKKTYKADARLVVVARKLRAGESESVDMSLVSLNPSPKYPQIWYDKNGTQNPYIKDEKWYPQEVVQ